MQIREAKAADRDEWIRMRSMLYSNPDPREVDEWLEDYGDRATHRVGIAVLVAQRADGSLAGFVEIGSRNYAEGCDTSPVAYLEGWYVDPDVRRTGLGARLAQAAESWAKAHGFSEMASDTELHNDISQMAHRALGYEEVERQICFRKDLR